MHENGFSFAYGSWVTSLLSAVALVAMPLSGWLMTRYKMPKAAMTGGLIATTLACVAIPYTENAVAAFVVYGVAFSAAAPVLAAFPAWIMRAEVRSFGIGIYFVWYFIGCALLPALAGYLNELTGMAEVAILLLDAMILASLGLAFAVYGLQTTLRTRELQRERRAGLRSFPWRPLSGSICPG